MTTMTAHPERYTLIIVPQAIPVLARALGALPFAEVNPLIQDLERQVQEQNFKAEQEALQARVAETNAEALALAAANPGAEPPTVEMTEAA